MHVEDSETVEYWEQNIASDQLADLTAEGEATHTDLLEWMDSPQGRENYLYWFVGLFTGANL